MIGGENSDKDGAAAVTAEENAMRAYATKELDFRYRGIGFRFALSHGLFSSADIDAGTRLLLKTVSLMVDADLAIGRPLPRTVLDAGSGIGVIGVAIGRALLAAGVDRRFLRVRAQDRDDLARVFSAANAVRNGLAPPEYQAAAEQLLTGDEEWELILSNLPAKAGDPVLRDFVFRSVRRLAPNGRVAVVIVQALADRLRRWLSEAGANLSLAESGTEHQVYIYGRPDTDLAGAAATTAKTASEAADTERAYRRGAYDFSYEDGAYRLETIHGAADFDTPSRAVLIAAKMIRKTGLIDQISAADRGLNTRILVYEPSQGHFPCWLRAAYGLAAADWVLCGRNVLALEAARQNLAAMENRTAATATGAIASLALADPAFRIPELLAAGLSGLDDRAAPAAFGFYAAFPVAVPRVDRTEALWEAAEALVAKGGWYLIAAASAEAERADRAKTAAFIRAGELKRDGFRALAYRRK